LRIHDEVDAPAVAEDEETERPGGEKTFERIVSLWLVDHHAKGTRTRHVGQVVLENIWKRRDHARRGVATRLERHCLLQPDGPFPSVTSRRWHRPLIGSVRFHNVDEEKMRVHSFRRKVTFQRLYARQHATKRGSGVTSGHDDQRYTRSDEPDERSPSTFPSIPKRSKRE